MMRSPLVVTFSRGVPRVARKGKRIRDKGMYGRLHGTYCNHPLQVNGHV